MKRKPFKYPAPQEPDLIVPDPLKPGYVGTYSPPREYLLTPQRKPQATSGSKPSSRKRKGGSSERD